MNEVVKMEQPQVVAAPADPMLAMIQHVVENGGDVEKLRELLTLKREFDADMARKAFHEAFAACQAEIPAVLRNKDNKQTQSRYADLAAIEAVAAPVIARHGLAVRFFPVKSDMAEHYGVDCIVSHRQGHSESYHADVPADGAGLKGNANKTATHAFGSTMSYGRRYLLCMIFNIATTDDDDGNAAAKGSANISEGQYVELQGLIDQAGIAENVVLTAEKVAALHFLPERRYASVRAKLETTIKNREIAQ
jgi:hypothetical protein